MIAVIQSLSRGETKYVSAFAAAKAFWDEFFAEHAALDDDALMKAVEIAQMKFEWRMKDCGLERYEAKPLMPMTCMSSLYDDVDGFDANGDLAIRTAKAFLRSRSVSGEIRTYAKDAIREFDLDEDEAELKALMDGN